MRFLGFASLAAAATLGACSGDLFHSTDWPNSCQANPGSCGGVDNAASSTGATMPTSGPGGGVGGAGGNGGSSVASTGANTTSSTGTGGSAPVCMPGEVQSPNNLHCYVFVATALDWASARADCVTRGGDLASITTAAENIYVAAGIPDTSWLGGTDAASEGTWVWSNGDGWSYANWNLGEPNNAMGNENCLTIYGVSAGLLGLWNDADCATLYPYVCERTP